MIKVIRLGWTRARRSRGGEGYFVARSTHGFGGAFFAIRRAFSAFMIGV